ncbi:MAG: ATP-grasp domain-containing protein, partial [Candidatus Firestonebacteria bacterium]|nr:ATP-grasp domain-containing protein [Candidatus Firestonebacteria bacterium]
MNILVIGSGGREHTIVWKLAQNKNRDKIYCAPGNPGIGELAELIPLEVTDINGLKKFAISHHIDITVVGPEVPLSLGISDIFSEACLAIFGPLKKASLLETSKIFAKEFMARNNIPTADFKIFSNSKDAIDFLKNVVYPVVIKADGLAQGKGVIVAENYNEAFEAVNKIMVNKIFGNAGNKILIENFLIG